MVTVSTSVQDGRMGLIDSEDISGVDVEWRSSRK
jgi:hypothetical protein